MGRLAAKLDEYDSLPAVDAAADAIHSVAAHGHPSAPPDASLLELIREDDSLDGGPTGGLSMGDASLIDLLSRPDAAPTSSLSALAERTRSQLMERQPRGAVMGVGNSASTVAGGISASSIASQANPPAAVSFAPPPAAPPASRPPQTAMAQAAPPPEQPSTKTAKRAGTAAAAAVGPSARGGSLSARREIGSMMTHPPSGCSHYTSAGRSAAGGGSASRPSAAPTPLHSRPNHTFGGALPRASPSGTMSHHAPRAVPTPAAAAALSARARAAATPRAPAARRASDSPAPDACAAAEDGTPDSGRPRSARASCAVGRRPSSAGSGSGGGGGSSGGAAGGGSADGDVLETMTFGADAKGGALAYRPKTAEGVRAAQRKGQLQALAGNPRTRGGGGGGTAFAFVVCCCGDEFEGYCCKRHHPDDRVVCCARHAPPERNSVVGGVGGARAKPVAVV